MKINRNGLLAKYFDLMDFSYPKTLCTLPWKLLGVTIAYLAITVAVVAIFGVMVLVPIFGQIADWIYPGTRMDHLIDQSRFLIALYASIALISYITHLYTKYLSHKPPSATSQVIAGAYRDFKEKTCTRIQWE